MTPLTTTPKDRDRFGWSPSVASARRAAERAVHAAAVASTWAGRSGVGRAEAAEALRAADRSRLAADMAEQSVSLEESVMFAAMALVLSQAALEADRRVSGLIGASLWDAAEQTIRTKPTAA